MIVDRVDDQERESAEREEAAGIKPNESREANAHRRAASEENAIENAFGCFFVVCGKADIISYYAIGCVCAARVRSFFFGLVGRRRPATEL